MDNRGEISTRAVMISPSPIPQWKREMEEHYARTGTVRSQDVQRVLGDRPRALIIGGPTDNSASFYESKS
jgi:hypothetical protein